MAHDERYSSRRRDRSEREHRPQRLGDRGFRGDYDDPEYGMDRYGAGPDADFPGRVTRGAPTYDGPGLDTSFGGPRFDRLDVGSVGTHGVHPVSSPDGDVYRGGGGITPGGSYRSSARRYAAINNADRGHRHDPHYSAWRERQIAQLDRDYDEYRRENQERFEREFGEWRERRSGQRAAVGRVREHMEVVGADGAHIGTVDGTRGDRIILTRSDPSSGGHHHSIPCAWIDRVEDKVKLSITGDEAHERWRNEEESRALFERDDPGNSGPGMLNRSFSGTYRNESDED